MEKEARTDGQTDKKDDKIEEMEWESILYCTRRLTSIEFPHGKDHNYQDGKWQTLVSESTKKKADTKLHKL